MPDDADDEYPGTIERLWQLWREHRAKKRARKSR